MIDALKASPAWDESKVRLFACWCVHQVEALLDDERSRKALDVAERFALGGATAEELSAAEDAAREAQMEALDAFADACEIGEAAGAAANAAWPDAAQAAASAAAHMAAAKAALALAKGEASDAAGTAAELTQAAKLREIFGNPFATCGE
jgi:hypothetical protein